VALLLLVAMGCSGGGKTAGDAGDDGAAGDGDGDDIRVDSAADFYRFSAEMDAHLVAARIGAEAADAEAGTADAEAGTPDAEAETTQPVVENDAGTTVCCDSEIGCFTSDEQGLCRRIDASVPIGNSFRFWFLHSTGDLSLSIQTSEPSTGFTGACLLGPDGRPADHVQLPAVCFSPEGNVQYGVGLSTEVIVRAYEVLQSDTPPPLNFDEYPYAIDYGAYHYQVLMTCYPKGASGACPAGSSAISSSCCNVGAPMTYLYVNLAHGFVDLTSN
jgi:hypothetical protein